MIKMLSVVRNWIVNDNDSFTPHPDKIDWLRAIPFILVNLSCILVFYVRWSGLAIGVAIALYYARLFAIGAFYHRYFSHKTFKTTRFWQFIFAALAGTAAQRGPLWWAAHHRQHHLVADQVEDVHSPSQHGFWWSHMGWFLSKKNYHYDQSRVNDLRCYPELVFLERYDVLMPLLLFMTLGVSGLMLEYYFPQYQTGVAEMLIWGFSVSLIAVFHTTVLINSLCHVYGSTRYVTQDKSKNNLLFALLTLGEGWHNNHHHYAACAQQGFHWWEIDITFYLIKLMERLGMVWDVKPIPKHILQSNLIKPLTEDQ